MTHYDSDTFDPPKLWGTLCKVGGILAIAFGAFTAVIGFRLDGVRYSGLMTGLSFALPGLTILGIEFLLSTAATIGEMLLENRKT